MVPVTVPPSAQTEAVAAALDALPADQRTVVLLARAGNSYARIGEQLDLPYARVRTIALQAVTSLTRARLAAA